MMRDEGTCGTGNKAEIIYKKEIYFAIPWMINIHFHLYVEIFIIFSKIYRFWIYILIEIEISLYQCFEKESILHMAIEF